MRKIWLSRIAILLLLVGAILCRVVKKRTPCEVVFFDVGNASAVLIRTENGNILVDAGSDDSEESLCNKLHELGVRSFDAVFFTHPDSDHIGGGDGILTDFSVKEIYTNGRTSESGAYDALLFSAKDIPIRTLSRGDTCCLLGINVEILSPADTATSENNGSLVLLFDLFGTKLLITGDAEQEIETELADLYGEKLKADILLCGHHGSDTSSADAFLETVAPDTIVISCADENRYAFPDGRALARMRKVCTDIRITGSDGDITIKCGKKD